MLDDRMKLMLETADTLTADDLEFIRSDGAAVAYPKKKRAASETKRERAAPTAPMPSIAVAVPAKTVDPVPQAASRGDYERKRTRESKVSTECLGEERVRHDWWPLGTEVVGQMGTEFFTAIVVENANVKSGRSLRLTSGSAQGRICITPTRAAMEATEDYRQANNLGRGGGVTNGWLFWQPRGGN